MQPLIQIRVLQFDGTPSPDVHFSFRPADGTEYQPLHGSYEPGSGVYAFVIDDYRPGPYVLLVEAPGYPVIEKKAEFRDAGYSSEVFLVDDGIECVKMGGRREYFRRKPEVVGVFLAGPEESVESGVSMSEALKLRLTGAGKRHLFFTRSIENAGSKDLEKRIRNEFPDALISTQAIEVVGGKIEFLGRQVGLELVAGAEWESVQQELGLTSCALLYRDPHLPSFYILGVDSAVPYAVLDVVERLLKSRLVRSCEPQLIATDPDSAVVLPGDLLRPWQWHLNSLRLPEAWEQLNNVNSNIKFGSADVILAIHDRGIETKAGVVQHPDLQGSVSGGSLTNYLGGNDQKVYYQFDFSRAAGARMEKNNDSISGAELHGISVAGVATAKSDGVTGIVGTAPNVRLASFMRKSVTTAGDANIYLANHIQFMAGLDPQWPASSGLYFSGEVFPAGFNTGGNAGPGASVINFSHAKSNAPDLSFVKALTRVTLLGRNRRGVILVTGAGNSDSNTRVPINWGNDQNILKVAASSLDHRGYEIVANYSSFSVSNDPAIDVSAPSSNRQTARHNPPRYYGVISHDEISLAAGLANSLPGTILTQAVIQNSLPIGATFLTLLPADLANFQVQTEVLIRHPTNSEILEHNTIKAAPGGAPPNSVGLATPLDTGFPAGSLLIQGPLLGIGTLGYVDTFGGTSASAPMISGIVALMLSANPRLTWSEVREILRETAVPVAIRFVGPGTAREKSWINDSAQSLIDANGLMVIPGGAPTAVITTALSKGATQILVANPQAFHPRQALTIGAETALTAATDPTGAAAPANQLSVFRADDFEAGDIIFIGKLIETIIEVNVNAVPAPGQGVSLQIINPDGFVIGDVLDVAGQQVTLMDIRGFHPSDLFDNPRNIFIVDTVGGVAFAAVTGPAIVRISSLQREGPFLVTAKAGNQLALNDSITQIHPINRIVQKENTEVAVVKQAALPAFLEVYPLINDHPTDNVPGNLHLTGGLRASYSHGFGYGRVDALEAVKAALNFTHDERDVMIRNFVGDDGVTNRATKTVESPDLWVTNDSPTQGLSSSLEGPHQRPRADISAPVFVGSGLNDLSADGVFTGTTVTNYLIKITTAGANDKFTWSKDKDAPSAEIAITPTEQDIDVNGLKVKFNAVTGHTIGDFWHIRCEKITNRHVHLRLHNRGTLPTFAASSFSGLITPVNQYRIFLCLSDGTPVVQHHQHAVGGLNDLSVLTDFNGATKDIITIKIRTSGATDTFVWSKGSGAFSAPVAITGGAQALINNVNVEYVKIQFAAVTGHKVNDTWVLKCYPAAEKFINIDHFVLSNPAVPFSLTANRPGTWMMDEQSFPVLLAGQDRYHSFPWPEDNRPARNGFGVALPARPLRMFIMGEVVPHDGRLMGDVAEQDNNFSYREIIFARFGFKKSNVLDEITSYVGVDSVGTATDEDFMVQIITDVSTFNAEAVKLEFVLEFINGTTETRVFEFNGGAWGFAGVDPLWCTMNASPKLADGTTNATDEQYYMTFDGTLSVSSAHKNIKITPKIHSTGNPAVVLAEETQSVAVMEQAELASGRYSGASPAALTPRSHFFTDHVGVLAQTDAIAYGPVISGTATDKQNKFRVTSLFKAASDVPAYAIVDGIVMLQRVADVANPGTFLPNVVNLVIKPYKQAMLGFTPVKYFVYRNLRLDEFLKGGSAADENLVRDEPGASVFIQGLWALHTAQNGTVPFESLVLGYDPANQPGSAKIDKLFNRQDSSKQLPFVARGLNLGKFYTNGGNDEFGVEFILDEGRFQPDYDYVRKYKQVVIDVSALPAVSDQDKFTLRLEREKILNYIDPAAFFGMHISKNGWLQVDDGAGNKTKTPPVDIYANVLTKFYTKNTLYIDIRNENGQSLNFSGGYNDGTGNALEVGDTAGSLTAQEYASDKWPLIIRPSSSAANTQAFNLAFLRLRLDYNHKPILYLEHGEPNGPTTKDRFIADEDLVAAAATETNTLGFRFPNHDLGSGNRVGVAWMLKMDYMMRQEPTTATTPFYLSNLFGPVDAEPLWTVDAPVIAWVSSTGKKYIDGDGIAALGFEHVADRGVAFSEWTGAASTSATASVLYYAAAKDTFVNNNQKLVPPNGITDGVSKRSSFFEEALLFDGYTVDVNVIVDGSDEVLTARLQASAPDSRPSEAMLVLGLTRSELDTHLKPLTGFDPRSARTVLLDEVAGSPFFDPGGQFYRKFRAGLSGLDDTGFALEAFPATDIFLYTADQKCFFTNAFTKALPLPTTYTRNYEEKFGERTRSGDVYEITAVAGANVTVTLVQPGEPPIELTREILSGDKVTIKSVEYNVSSVSNTGTNSGVLTLATAPANVVPGTDRLYAPEKPLEEYFIARDQLGPISGIDPMATLVAAFVTAVDGVADDSSAPAAIEIHINNFGAKILERARRICSHNGFSYADDRILYWARIKMMVKMKSHPYLCKVPAKRNDLVKVFETVSRGYEGVKFTAAPSGHKKVLITGFDPFQLSFNTMRSNPSGAAALALHDQNHTLNGVSIHIQSAILPNRYSSFDENVSPAGGVVESVFERFINPAIAGEKPDVIVTVSQGGILEFWLDRFASRARGGVADNLNDTHIPFPDNVVGDEFYETNLPETKMVPSDNKYGDFKVFYNNYFWYQWDLKPLALFPEDSCYPFDLATKPFETEKPPRQQPDSGALKVEDPNYPKPNPVTGIVPSLLTNSTIPRKDAIRSRRGSGGHYLSNETFYRVSRLRAKHNPSMITGHYHIPQIQHNSGDKASTSSLDVTVKTTKNFNADLLRKMILEIRDALVRASS